MFSQLPNYAMLAWTKIRTRKLRSVLSMLSATFTLTIMLVFCFTTTGTDNSVKNIIPAGFENTHVAIANNMAVYSEQNTNTSNTAPVTEITAESYKDAQTKSKNTIEVNASKYGENKTYAIDVYNSVANWIGNSDKCSGSYYSEAQSPKNNTDTPTCGSTEIADDAIFSKFVSDGQNYKNTNSLPVLISYDQALKLTGKQIKPKSSPNETLQVYKSAVAEAVGKKIDIKFELSPSLNESARDSTQPTTKKLPATVVGVFPQYGIVFDLIGTNNAQLFNDQAIIIPKSSAKSVLEDKEYIYTSGNTTYFVEFDDVSALKKFIANSCKDDCYNDGATSTEYMASYFTDYGLAFQDTFKQVFSILRWVLLFFLIMTVLSITSSVGKVLIDSKREIGVFRAIGARKSQISLIYGIYVWFLVTFAFGLSSIIAFLMTMYFNHKLADSISVGLATAKGGSSISGTFSFFGFNILWVGGIYLIMLLAAIGGSLLPLVKTLRRSTLKYLRDE